MKHIQGSTINTVSCFNQITSNKQSKPQSKVLLVSFYNINHLIVSHEIFYNLFSQYGKVLKILVFEKTKIWKLFVKYQDIQSSIAAYNSLQDFQIFNDGSKFNINYSKIHNFKLNDNKLENNHKNQNIQQLNHDNNYDQQSIETTIRKKYPIIKFPTYDQSQINKVNRHNHDSKHKLKRINTDYISYDQQLEQVDTQIHHSANQVQDVCYTFQDLIEEQMQQNLQENQKFELDNQIDHDAIKSIKQQKMQLNLDELDDVLTNLECKLIEESQQQDEHKCHTEMYSEQQFHNQYDDFQNQSVVQQNIWQHIHNFNLFFNQKMIQNRNYSQILVLKQVKLMNLNLEMIFNLFCNYGNIDFIFYIEQKNVVLIQYENLISAVNAQDLLNDKQFLNIHLKIGFSKFQYIDKSLEDKHISYYPNKKQNRFYDYCNLQINPPSETLHISNIATKSFIKDKLLRIFSVHGKIMNFEIVDTENQKNMCFIKYSDMQESFRAIAYLHGHKLNGRNLRLSFTKTKLNTKKSIK